MIQPLAITHCTLVNALGKGKAATLQALLQQRSGLHPCDFLDANLDTFIGRVAGLEHAPVSSHLADFDCRNNRLAEMGLKQDDFIAAANAARQRYGAHRVAVIMGTSTSGILQTEQAYRERDPATGALPAPFHYEETHDIASVAEFTRRFLQLEGPCIGISTACSSSAKVFASAHRLIQSGACDAAIVGGVDSLCFTTLYGFSSLELVSTRPCRPADATRDGISIGEAAGFALLEKIEGAPAADTVALLGYGESSDAHHMSTPHPEGLGAALAMQQALQRAGLNPDEIDYINLHGTASKTNDSAEDQAVSRIFGRTPCSSTKGWTGHTLGAAGITEAIIGYLCILNGFMPGSQNTETIDPAFSSHVLLRNQIQPVKNILSNSFGFGGNNCSIVLGKVS